MGAVAKFGGRQANSPFNKHDVPVVFNKGKCFDRMRYGNTITTTGEGIKCARCRCRKDPSCFREAGPVCKKCEEQGNRQD